MLQLLAVLEEESHPKNLPQRQPLLVSRRSQEGEDKKDKKTEVRLVQEEERLIRNQQSYWEKVFDFHSKLRDFETNRPQDLTERAALLADKQPSRKNLKL